MVSQRKASNEIFCRKNSGNNFPFGNSLDSITDDVLHWNELGNLCLLSQTEVDIAAKTCNNKYIVFTITAAT